MNYLWTITDETDPGVPWDTYWRLTVTATGHDDLVSMPTARTTNAVSGVSLTSSLLQDEDQTATTGAIQRHSFLVQSTDNAVTLSRNYEVAQSYNKADTFSPSAPVVSNPWRSRIAVSCVGFDGPSAVGGPVIVKIPDATAASLATSLRIPTGGPTHLYIQNNTAPIIYLMHVPPLSSSLLHSSTRAIIWPSSRDGGYDPNAVTPMHSLTTTIDKTASASYRGQMFYINNPGLSSHFAFDDARNVYAAPALIGSAFNASPGIDFSNANNLTDLVLTAYSAASPATNPITSCSVFVRSYKASGSYVDTTIGSVSPRYRAVDNNGTPTDVWEYYLTDCGTISTPVISGTVCHALLYEVNGSVNRVPGYTANVFLSAPAPTTAICCQDGSFTPAIIIPYA